MDPKKAKVAIPSILNLFTSFARAAHVLLTEVTDTSHTSLTSILPAFGQSSRKSGGCDLTMPWHL